MPCGVVLREALKHEAITALILHDESRGNEKAANIDQINPEMRQSGEGVFWKFFPWIDKGAFEVSTDAFTTFRVSHYKLSSYFFGCGTDNPPRTCSRNTGSLLRSISRRILIFFSRDTTQSWFNQTLMSRRGNPSSY